MREMGLCGVTRGKTVKTTQADPDNANPRDLVKRQFTAERCIFRPIVTAHSV